MAFFDNWRVHFASTLSYDEGTERRLQSLEEEYATADAGRQQEIFQEYKDSVNGTQRKPVSYVNVGDIFSLMWAKSCELYPELAVVTDDNARHAILACRTKEQQDAMLREYLQRSVTHVDNR